VTSKEIWIEWRRSTSAMICQCFCSHTLKSFGGRPRKEFIPSTFGFYLSEQPRTNRFLLVFRQLVRFLNRALEKFTHDQNSTAATSPSKQRCLGKVELAP